MKMSIFKEKDDFITRALRNQFDSDSEDESFKDKHASTTQPELHEEHEKSKKKPKLQDDCSISSVDTQLKTSPSVGKSFSTECVDLSSSNDDEYSLDQKLNDYEIVLNDDEPDCITISSDDEPELLDQVTQRTETSTGSVQITNASFDLDDLEFNLKLNVAGTYKKFSTTYKTTLFDSLREYREELKSKNRELLVMLNNECIDLNNSPFSLELQPSSILTAIEVIKASEQKSDINSNLEGLKLKLQDGNRKHTKEFRIRKDDPISKLREMYASEFKIEDPSKIKLLFDGDIICDDSTPDELEIEDDCVIDVLVS